MAGATRPALISVSGVGATAFDWTLKRTALARVACGGQQRTVSGGRLSALRPNRRTLNANLPSVRYETLQLRPRPFSPIPNPEPIPRYVSVTASHLAII